MAVLNFNYFSHFFLFWTSFNSAQPVIRKFQKVQVVKNTFSCGCKISNFGYPTLFFSFETDSIVCNQLSEILKKFQRVKNTFNNDCKVYSNIDHFLFHYFSFIWKVSSGPFLNNWIILHSTTPWKFSFSGWKMIDF